MDEINNIDILDRRQSEVLVSVCIKQTCGDKKHLVTGHTHTHTQLQECTGTLLSADSICSAQVTNLQFVDSQLLWS